MLNIIPRTKDEIEQLEQELREAIKNFRDAKQDQDENRATKNALKVAEIADQLVRSEER